jgi:hypothetical protein
MAVLAAALAVTVGCAGGGAEGEGEGEGEGDVPGGLPATPSAGANELVFVSRDSGTDTTVTCTGDGWTKSYGTQGASSAVTLTLACLQGDDQNRKQLTLQVMRDQLPAGSYDISSEHLNPPSELDGFGVAVVDAGVGYAVGGTASTAPAFTGRVSLDATSPDVSGTFFVTARPDRPRPPARGTTSRRGCSRASRRRP